MATALILASAIAGAGLAVPELRTLGRAWGWVVLFLVWGGPLLLLAWAAAAASRTAPVGLDVAIAIGGAGAALSFALALGPEARYLAEPIGRAPYWLLTELSSSFEGTRVPARFGGISLLFLAMRAAGALAALARARRPGLRLLSAGAGVVALVACFAELPVGSLPRGRFDAAARAAPRERYGADRALPLDAVPPPRTGGVTGSSRSSRRTFP